MLRFGWSARRERSGPGPAVLRPRLACPVLVMAALWLAATPAAAIPVFLAGWDADLISFPRFTEAGLVSITTGTNSPTGTPGFAYTGPIFNDFSANPDGDTQGLDDLWFDGHLVLPLTSTSFAISGLTPGSGYDLVLLSHGPNGESTRFDVTDANGTSAQTVGAIPFVGADLWSTQTATFWVDVPASGTIQVTMQAAPNSLFGVLNGLVLVDSLPEPSLAILLGIGALAGGLRRRDRRHE